MRHYRDFRRHLFCRNGMLTDPEDNLAEADSESPKRGGTSINMARVIERVIPREL